MPATARGAYYPIFPDTVEPSSSVGNNWHGIGAPAAGLGQNGDTYLDISSGDVYLKYGGAWHVFQGAPGGSGEAGVGSPEGVITAGIGTTYVDTSNGDLWVKASGAGNTGWVAVFLH